MYICHLTLFILTWGRNWRAQQRRCQNTWNSILTQVSEDSETTKLADWIECLIGISTLGWRLDWNNLIGLKWVVSESTDIRTQ